MAFTPLIAPEQGKRPKTASTSGSAGMHNMLRDQLTLQTWLALGALLQTTTFLLLGNPALYPAALYVAYTLTATLLAAANLTPNPLMDGVLLKKFSSAFPDLNGTYPSKPASTDIVVFLIGARNNHPLGLLAPGVKELGEYMPSMVRALESHPEEYGLLGMTSWTNSSVRTTQSELMQVCYFRSVEGLHKFAHSEHHTGAWKWWNAHVKTWTHLSIYHETYHVPAGNWETVHVNSHVSGLPSSRVWTEEGWASPVVDASKGLLRTSAGRMARSEAREHEGVVVDPY